MKVLIDLPEDTLNHLASLAVKKGWSRKQYMEWLLKGHSNVSLKRDQAKIKL